MTKYVYFYHATFSICYRGITERKGFGGIITRDTKLTHLDEIKEEKLTIEVEIQLQGKEIYGELVYVQDIDIDSLSFLHEIDSEEETK